MKRVIATVLLVMMGSLSTAHADQPIDCGEVSTYLEMVDARMVEEVFAVVSAPGWAEGASEAQDVLASTDGTYEGVSREDVAPMLDYLGVPGKVLTSIEATDVPESTSELHESAAAYWSESMDMIETAVNDGTLAGTPRVAHFEALIARNIAAQDELRSSCSDVVQPYEERQEALADFFAVLGTEDGAAAFEAVTPADLQGVGYSFLFFAEPPVEARHVTVNSTPVVVQDVDATPAD